MPSLKWNRICHPPAHCQCKCKQNWSCSTYANSQLKRHQGSHLPPGYNLSILTSASRVFLLIPENPSSESVCEEGDLGKNRPTSPTPPLLNMVTGPAVSLGSLLGMPNPGSHFRSNMSESSWQEDRRWSMCRWRFEKQRGRSASASLYSVSFLGGAV